MSDTVSNSSQLVAVNSSNIAAIGDNENNDLFVKFKNGELWQYAKAGMHASVMIQVNAKGQSVGHYFVANVKGRYAETLVSSGVGDSGSPEKSPQLESWFEDQAIMLLGYTSLWAEQKQWQKLEKLFIEKLREAYAKDR